MNQAEQTHHHHHHHHGVRVMKRKCEGDRPLPTRAAKVTLARVARASQPLEAVAHDPVARDAVLGPVLASVLCADVCNLVLQYDPLCCWVCHRRDISDVCTLCGLYLCCDCRDGAFALTYCGGCGATVCQDCYADEQAGSNCLACPFTEYDRDRCASCGMVLYGDDGDRCACCRTDLCHGCAWYGQHDDGCETLLVICSECQALFGRPES